MTQHRDHETNHSTPYHPGDGYAEDGTEFHLPADHWPLPELTHLDAPHAEPTNADFLAAHGSNDFKRLRSTFRGFAFPMTAAALVSYFTFVLLSMYNLPLMTQPFFGLKGLNTGFVLGLAQFALVWIWTALYVNFANNKIDPAAGALRERLEKGASA